MPSPHEVLKRYWGFDKFRSLQQEIVESVLDGNDTLALLPTGGGKSICFQVPALCIGKLCIVVSPLIALMKDQVENLLKRGVTAAMISSAMKQVEIDLLIDKCMQGNYQFLYVSPERLQSESFTDVLPKLDIGLIAVDEAHCISQWGYDFRPSYLEIALIRPLLPGITIIALTATATPQVCDDIESRLHFRNNKRFKKSFLRGNLAYVVRNGEDKQEQLLNILQKVPGSSVVYVRNRKRTRDVAEYLTLSGISASYYHAGLDGATRSLRQQYWIEGKVRVIVCTNAFGMGIDKPDVRTVIHLEVPDTPEAYFQEAGRAGRDEQKAWAILLTDDGDEKDAEIRFAQQFPGFDTVKAVYNWLGNYLQLPVGSGEGQSYPFDIVEFSRRYKIHPIECVNAIRFIERDGLISFQENQYSASRLFIPVNKQELYEFELKNPKLEPLIKAILRSYGGTFQDFVQIREQDLATRAGLSEKELREGLKLLDKADIISYYPASDEPLIYFNMARQHPERLPLSLKSYEERKNSALERKKSILRYIRNGEVCRSVQLVSYFGEKNPLRCGQCDVCLEQGKNGFFDAETGRIYMRVRLALSEGKLTVEQLLKVLPHQADKVLAVIRTMIDEEELLEDGNKKLVLTTKE